MLASKTKKEAMPLGTPEQGLIYARPDPGKMELREIEKSFARVFSSEEGRKVLAYLQVMTFHRTLGPETSDAHLRYAEGQRAMVATILRLIDRGRKPA